MFLRCVFVQLAAGAVPFGYSLGVWPSPNQQLVPTAPLVPSKPPDEFRVWRRIASSGSFGRQPVSTQIILLRTERSSFAIFSIFMIFYSQPLPSNPVRPSSRPVLSRSLHNFQSHLDLSASAAPQPPTSQWNPQPRDQKNLKKENFSWSVAQVAQQPPFHWGVQPTTTCIKHAKNHLWQNSRKEVTSNDSG